MALNNLLDGLNQASGLIYQNNKVKGFWDKERNIGELLMLVTSELGEAMEAHRKSKFANWDNYHKSCLQLGNSPDTFDAVLFGEHIKDTFEDEIADAVIRLLDLSAGLGIDLEKHISSKVQYNETRPTLHGKSY